MDLDIRVARRARGLSQKRLAGLIGAHPSEVSRWEGGLRTVPQRWQLALIRVLGQPHEHGKIDSDVRPESGPPEPYLDTKAPQPTMAALRSEFDMKPKRDDGLRTCSDCGLTKPLSDFTPIRACRAGWYGRCRRCRARREWERNHPGRCYEEWLALKSRQEGCAQVQVRACKECRQVKPIGEFTPIKACRAGWYGRCRVCRNKRARERYHSRPEVRAAEIARASKNQRLRREGQPM